MIVAGTEADLRACLAPRRISDRIALVPTMGCLHEGHRCLIRRAREMADTVVVSIYVNPLQFGPGEDFDAYPRPFEEDAAACEREGVDALFHPQNLFPGGAPQVMLRAGEMARCLCGIHRPGHFDGVLTVVAALFNLVQPHVAVFGEKDWQQLTLIRRMTLDLRMPVEIAACETVREEDGLAASSRNRYLDPDDRARAAGLHAALKCMRERAQAGEKRVKALLAAGLARLREAGIDPEYLEIRAADTLAPLSSLGRPPARAFVAARIGKVRLIDNMALEVT